MLDNNIMQQIYFLGIILDVLNMPNCRNVLWNEVTGTPKICVKYETAASCLSAEECMSEINLVDQSACTVSTKDLNSNPFKIYPNPASDKIMVKGDNLTSIRIFDIRGQLLFAKTINSTESYEINVDSFTNGLYQIMINNSTIEKIMILR